MLKFGRAPFLSMLGLSMLTVLPLSAGAALAPDSPTVLITGANRGIGFELAKQYAEKGWNVIATSRRAPDDKSLTNLQALAKKHPKVAIERIDVTDTAMIRSVAQKYKAQPIDVLINNAAAVESTFAADMAETGLTWDKIDFDDARTDFDVNTLGPMRMVQAFMPNVLASKHKKLIAVTSMAGSFGKPLPGAIGMNYGASKAALNKYMVLLSKSKDLAEKGVKVALVQPIFVASKSDMQNMKNAAPLNTEIAKLIQIIDTLPADRNGKITNFQTGEVDPF
jgi:NAD(P)-dependent dehydrogenase (short-subunit alcohol dehydrogenase family)